jgi:hypothetical protein
MCGGMELGSSAPTQFRWGVGLPELRSRRAALVNLSGGWGGWISHEKLGGDGGALGDSHGLQRQEKWGKEKGGRLWRRCVEEGKERGARGTIVEEGGRQPRPGRGGNGWHNSIVHETGEGEGG